MYLRDIVSKALCAKAYILSSLIITFVVSCATNYEAYKKDGYPVKHLAIRVEGMISPSERNVFFAKFRKLIDKRADYPLISPPQEEQNATHILHITIDNKTKEFAGFDHRQYSRFSGSTTVKHYQSYQINVRLVKVNGMETLWTWHPEEWSTYTDYSKSIEWLANKASSEMKKGGLLDPSIYR